ncbi:MAG: hypothetical protein H7Y20_03395, partial [Bryobacteraceae bacterium]|nr:hypothetical protein [Bryobacteraceae bacterium]
TSIKQAVETFRAVDPTASFTYFNGHVDSFSAAGKLSIPDYALPTLSELGLSLKARSLRKLDAPLPAGTARPARDLDKDPNVGLPYVQESKAVPPVATKVSTDGSDRGLPGQTVPVEARNQPPKNPDTLIAWERPDDRTLALERRAATPILQSFVTRYRELFAVSSAELSRALRLTDYESGAYFRKATYEQFFSASEKVLYGRTLVHFDLNWNVIGISRMIITPAKFAPPAVAAPIRSDEAVRIASAAFPDKSCAGSPSTARRAELAIDILRNTRVWDVEMLAQNGTCHWRAILEAASGKQLNVSDLVDRAYTDAKVNRWSYPNGDLFAPQQTVSNGIYTRNDLRLEHDFFYMMNDHRCEGLSETACGETTFPSNWCSSAYGSTSGPSYIRATRRTNRDFSPYFPSGSSETFGETHSYYWSRQFSQWLKPSLDSLGVLPNSASDYPRVLMISDACRSGSVHNSSFSVTTDDNKGEGTNVIRLAHTDPTGSSNHNRSCEGNGCFDNPSNIHHEMNHFFLKRYYDVGSDLDCGSSNQLKFTHEGILGTAVPQAFWHNYYGVGYNPSSTNKLYFSHSTIGRVHTSDTNKMTVGNYLCTNNTGDPYTAGRVVAQALWEFYHGVKMSGSTQGSTWSPSTDTDFNTIVYWAADLQAASTYKDRYEFANRVMEILENHSNWSSGGKSEYCSIFEHHGLRNFIQAGYCN